ncbi:helix-turn-helix domain-containing protein [Nocardia sp. CA-135953]|uniref:helix-turn-helix domain-containing protein n=1 Tax=Nocardia sp. CA-135953 TaxID=3239978 RepID=UPI003D981FD1
MVGGWWDAAAVARHTSFRFCMDPTVEQRAVPSRHAGAARFVFDQCLHAVKSASTARRSDAAVPWSGFDLIDYFNRWKKSEQAGRVFVVDTTADATLAITGSEWRDQVCQ